MKISVSGRQISATSVKVLMACGLLTGFSNITMASVIDFEDIATTGVTTYASYSTAEYQIVHTGPPTTLTDLFGSWGSNNAGYYAGSSALFINRSWVIATLSRIDGGSFSLQDIDLSELATNLSCPCEVEFIGELTGGGTVAQTFALDGVFGFENFVFGTEFSSVTSVSWNRTVGEHQFDNINVGAAVPVPAAVYLLGSGLLGLFGVARRKGATQ